ncbi:MAG: L-2-amino-thiazoline-4-carboxylic acid hydrolase [Planctomycetota bacterium]|nr:L-2-amino-thiazoline-4-carboxylic acid hydrolase [Planctomycetota bacterium]
MPSPLSILRGELGLAGSLAVLMGCLGRRLGGEPYRGTAVPADRLEDNGRRLARWALLLHRELASRLGAAEGLALATRMCVAGSVADLRRRLGNPDADAFADLDEEGRRQQVRTWVDSFPNADATIEQCEPQRVSFTVRRCSLVEACAAAGQTELAAAFCEGDSLFFPSLSPPIEIERSQTIATGGSICDFRLCLESPLPAAGRPSSRPEPAEATV